MIGRRNFLRLSALTAAGALLGAGSPPHLIGSASSFLFASRSAQAAFSTLGTQYSGTDLDGWEIAVGDGVYAAPGEEPVSLSDLETLHYGTHSELKANILLRGIMAHNITFKRFIADDVFDFIHTFGYKFRLPYLPSIDNEGLNPQTIEGYIGLWDGGDTRLDYDTGFQWYINPWGPDTGDLRTWTDIDGGKWASVGHLPLDMEWHELRIVLDVRRETTALLIDGVHYLSRFNRTPKPADWGTETSATITAEIISMYPGESQDGTLHISEFKDWYWLWEPYNTCATFVPYVVK